MKKGVFSKFFLLCALFIILPIASAEIIISQPSPLYNLGDTLSISLSVHSSSSSNNFLTGKIICTNGEIEILKTPYTVNPGEDKNLTIEAKLDKFLVGDLLGSCHFQAYYNGEEENSQEFEITDRINLNLLLKNSILSPGDLFSISGTAMKSNGKNIDGFFEMSLPNNVSQIKGLVNDGSFSKEVSIPSNSPAGQFSINVKVYEKDSNGEITNKGESSVQIKIKQIVKRSSIAISEPAVFPSNNLSYTILLYDQTDSEAKLESTVTIYNPNGEIYSKKIVNSGEANYLPLDLTAPPGYWNIESSYDKINAKKSFFVEEIQKVSFSRDNQTLIVKNIGNVIYKKSVEVLIGENTEIINLDLDIGEEKRFKILAPNGDYQIKVREDSVPVDLGNSYLTGNAIAIKDLNNLSSGTKIALWIWIFLILIALAFVILYYRKARRWPFTGKTPSAFSLERAESKIVNSIPKSKYIPITDSSFPTKEINAEAQKMKLETYETKEKSDNKKSESNKDNVIVLAIKIKNLEKLTASESSAPSIIEKALENAKLSKAKVYDQGSFKTIVFSEKLSKRNDSENALEAVKSAKYIESAINSYNKKHAIRIEYGLGASNGEMFLEIIDGKPKFTSIGSTTIAAKNAAEKANNEILISPSLHRKTYNVVKVEQTPLGLFKVNSIIDRNQHSQFIDKFMKKNVKK